MGKLLLAALAGTATLSVPASAALLNFSFASPNGATSVFQLDSNPQASSSLLVSASDEFPYDYVEYFNIPVTTNGVSQPLTVGFARNVRGQQSVSASSPATDRVFAGLGPVPYTGLSSSPTFAPGVFDYASDANSEFPNGRVFPGGRLTISPAAPGPLAGLGLFPALAGFGALIATRRRRRKPTPA